MPKKYKGFLQGYQTGTAGAGYYDEARQLIDQSLQPDPTIARRQQEAVTQAAGQFGAQGSLGSARSANAAAQAAGNIQLQAQRDRQQNQFAAAQTLGGFGAQQFGQDLQERQFGAGRTDADRNFGLREREIELGLEQQAYDRQQAANQARRNRRAGTVSTVLGAAALFSDERIKSNSELKGFVGYNQGTPAVANPYPELIQEPALPVYEYDNNLTGQRETGVMAQDVEQIPMLERFVMDDEATGLKKVDYVGLIGALMEEDNA